MSGRGCVQVWRGVSGGGFSLVGKSVAEVSVEAPDSGWILSHPCQRIFRKVKCRPRFGGWELRGAAWTWLRVCGVVRMTPFCADRCDFPAPDPSRHPLRHSGKRKIEESSANDENGDAHQPRSLRTFSFFSPPGSPSIPPFIHRCIRNSKQFII